MIGSKPILSAAISNALASYVQVDPKKIQTELLSPDGKICLGHVHLKEQRIPVADAGDFITVLVVSGTIGKITLEWTWANAAIQKSELSLEKVRLQAYFATEKKEATYKESNTKMPQTFWQAEYERLKDCFSIDWNSETIMKPLRDILDNFSIRVQDFEFSLPTSKSASAAKIITRIRSVNFLSVKSIAVKDELEHRRIILEFTFDSLEAKLSKKSGTQVILEPFSYKARIRRFSGIRFVDLDHGFEVIGEGKSSSKNHQIALNASTEILDAVWELYDIMVDDSSSAGPADESMDSSNGALKTELVAPMPVPQHGISYSLLATYALVGVIAYYAGAGKGRNMITPLGKTNIVFFTISMFLMVNLFKRFKSRQAKSRQISLSKLNQKTPSVFRFPIPTITLTLDSMIVRLSTVALVGRCDGFVVKCSVDTIEASGLPLSLNADELQFSAAGLRGALREGKALFNVDEIHVCHLPGVLRLDKPLLATVGIYESGALRLKLKSVQASRVEAILQEPQDTNIIIHHESPSQARKSIYKELYQITENLRDVARIFEELPVQDNRLNLRLYRRTFRGQEAVDFLLDRKLAKSRKEAVKLALGFQIEFNLFENVTREFKFRDEYECLFRFTDVSKRRSWEDGTDQVTTASATISDQNLPPALPFPVLIKAEELNWSNDEKGNYFVTKDFEINADPGIFPRVVDCTLSIGDVQHPMVEISNIMVRAIIHPDLPNEVHHLQISCDYINTTPGYSTEDWSQKLGLKTKEAVAEVKTMFKKSDLSEKMNGSFEKKTTPGYSTEDWYQKLGLRTKKAVSEVKTMFKKPDLSGNMKGSFEKKMKLKFEKKKESLLSKSESFNEPASSFSLPFVFISRFQLGVRYRSMFNLVQLRNVSVNVPPFVGTEKTTVNDLIKHFVIIGLGRSPGMLKDLRVFGVNIVGSAGLFTCMRFTARMIPGGDFYALGSLAAYDATTGALDAGKAARNDPNGSWRPGDFFRGVSHAAVETAKYGAEKRGKFKDEYDDKDFVLVDPTAVDFFAGAGIATANYASRHHARFTGAVVCTSVAITLTVTMGPLGGMFIGALSGAAAEWTVNTAEEKVKEKLEDDESKDE